MRSYAVAYGAAAMLMAGASANPINSQLPDGNTFDYVCSCSTSTTNNARRD